MLLESPCSVCILILFYIKINGVQDRPPCPANSWHQPLISDRQNNETKNYERSIHQREAICSRCWDTSRPSIWIEVHWRHLRYGNNPAHQIYLPAAENAANTAIVGDSSWVHQQRRLPLHQSTRYFIFQNDLCRLCPVVSDFGTFVLWFQEDSGQRWVWQDGSAPLRRVHRLASERRHFLRDLATTNLKKMGSGGDQSALTEGVCTAGRGTC